MSTPCIWQYSQYISILCLFPGMCTCVLVATPLLTIQVLHQLNRVYTHVIDPMIMNPRIENSNSLVHYWAVYSSGLPLPKGFPNWKGPGRGVYGHPLYAQLVCLTPQWERKSEALWQYKKQSETERDWGLVRVSPETRIYLIRWATRTR